MPSPRTRRPTGSRRGSTHAGSIATENYLKQIHSLALRGDPGAPRDQVLMSELASALSLTRGTVTTQVKRLARERLVRYERYGGVALTARGERLALGVLHRHRLVETFLVRTLGLDWSEVHEEAEQLEHVLSERVLQALDRWLGRPAVDPHGDPIPRRAKQIRGTSNRSGRSPAPRGARGGVSASRSRGGRPSRERALSDCAAGQRVRVKRLLEQGAAFLKLASRHGITPGADLVVLTEASGARSMRVRTGRRVSVAIKNDHAAHVLVVELRSRS